MRLFLKILGGFFALILLLVLGWWGASKRAARPGPEAPPLAVLSDDGLQAAIDAVAAERKLVGMAAQVEVGGDIVAQAVTGLKREDGDAALSLTDLFHIGSIGKSMSATTLATLVEDGVMTWDETLGGRLDGVVAMHPDWADTTLSQLLTHTSGVGQPPLSMMMNSVTEPVRLREIRRELAAKVLEEPPATPPGTAFSYSNVGYTLASIMAEEATGETWETLVKTRLAGPLGLDTLGFGAPVDGGDNQSVPWGHTRVGPIHMSMNPAETTDNPRWMAAAGTLHISLQELLDYGRAHLEAGRGDDALLSPEMFDYLHTPVMDEYGHGWVVQTRDFADDGTEETVIWHNGTNTMWYAVLLIVPRRDAVIALVTNDGAGYAGTQARFDQLAKEILLELPVKAP